MEKAKWGSEYFSAWHKFKVFSGSPEKFSDGNKISFLPRFKVLTFLVWWFKLGLEVKIKQKNSFYFQTRLVQTCSNLLAERLSKKCSFPVTKLKLCRILSEWDWIQTIERFSWAIRSCLPSFALWWIENWFREPKGYLNGSLCCFVRYSKHMYVCFCPGRVAELTEVSANSFGRLYF